jgi:lysozyme family protein
MADFQKALAILLSHEGGFAPQDNTAGAVNFGITARFLKSLGLPHSTADVRALTKERASGLYAMHFWNPLRLKDVKDQKLATLIFSMAVNMGPKKAVRLLQAALNNLSECKGKPERLAVDGALGPKTIAAVNGQLAEDVVGAFRKTAEGEYRRLAEANPSLYGDDLKGWLKRLESLSA